jgi:hypothetical protein
VKKPIKLNEHKKNYLQAAAIGMPISVTKGYFRRGLDYILMLGPVLKPV